MASPRIARLVRRKHPIGAQLFGGLRLLVSPTALAETEKGGEGLGRKLPPTPGHVR